jgi:UDP-N-acetylmuramyl-tripeptide synthetase
MTSIMPTQLRRLLADAGDARVNGDPEVLISSITVDSRAVEHGALFVCIRGEHNDGHAFVGEAVRDGAAAILAEHPVDVPKGTTVVEVPDALAALSPIAAEFYGKPSEALTCVGVTGTNGKTTTTHFIEAIARAAGKPFGLVGTLGARLAGSFDVQIQHTTPYAHQLQAILAAIRNADAPGAVLEISSHALALHRVDDVAFDVAALTNVTHDHLDFHGSFAEYVHAKRQLFQTTGRGGLKQSGTSVVNVDDAVGRVIAKESKRALTFAVHSEAMLRATDIDATTDGSSFRVRAVRPTPFTVKLPGPFNVSNALAAIAVGSALDFDVEAIAEGLASVTEVRGRMTAVPAPGFSVYVDYAHTPDGLRNLLTAAHGITGRRVLCVFGCGGDRDPFKRPVMGRLARELADHVVLTSDNPRYEDPQSIFEDVLTGVKGGASATFEVIPDRAAAIERAITLAKSGDVVVIAGKGHEPYQLVEGHRIPFSDVDVAAEAIRKVRT